MEGQNASTDQEKIRKLCPSTGGNSSDQTGKEERAIKVRIGVQRFKKRERQLANRSL